MLDKTFNAQDAEQACYQRWEHSGYFKPQGQGASYSMVIPPPNVTGSLHMGHAFQQTLMDVLVRYHRMKQDNTLWLVGTDHAGIATQMVVERQLAEQQIKRTDLGRAEFIDKIWQWKAQSGDTIKQQMRRLGNSVDWSRERFTLDEDLVHAVQTAFIKLHDEGLIYRGQRLVNWDPVLGTAISDLEVETKEEVGSLWHIHYPLSNGEPGLTIATTRPETLLGDVAVAVHPDDPRYQHLIGQTLKIPLCNRIIPIIADTYVEPEFGTGCVKITPAHDFNDFAIGQRHQLASINIFDAKAHLNENVPEAYQGLERFAARMQIIEALRLEGYLVKTEAHILKVPRGDRTQAILEPWLTDQWFIKMTDLAAPAIEAVRQGELRFIPSNWEKTYFEWLNNIEDWCISRQLWWGHRIPAWYDEQGVVYVGHNEAEIRARHKLADHVKLRQDDDVLDTWFSSALWPFSTLGWPNQTADFDTFYPTQSLVTGFDIIFFWVARMVMFGLKFTKKVPFKEVYIHGLIQDHQGAKMSKSKGNVLDPLDLIDGISLPALLEKRSQGLMQAQMRDAIQAATLKQFPDGIPAYGTDALRLTFCMLATHGRHIRFDLKRIEGYRHFCNKLWNAARFVLLHTEDFSGKIAPDSLSDKWILSLWNDCKQNVRQALDNYRFDLAAMSLYDFVWNEYCDWYLELCKPVLSSRTMPQLAATQSCLLQVLEEILRMFHPIMPFISETLWLAVAPVCGIENPQTLMLQAYPDYDSQQHDAQAVVQMNWLKAVIDCLRTLRSELKLKPNQDITLLVQHASSHEQNALQEALPYLKSLSKVKDLQFLNDLPFTDPAVVGMVGSLSLYIAMEGLVDPDDERKRLDKELTKSELELSKIQARLDNSNYRAKAPAAVIAKEEARALELQGQRAELKQRLKLFEPRPN